MGGGAEVGPGTRWVAGLAAARRPAYTFRSAHSVHSGMPTLRFGGSWSRGWRGLLILIRFPCKTLWAARSNRRQDSGGHAEKRRSH
ncbi:hypothetical protein MILUP08_46293 [Micromonospora lupini str. Lupac 08]|uniref:Uncharacterized protein n=1 Tax=Micromonospora lupini str. Lupac 08 TaxID=1150864 RepID=I0LC49_9ACTN|nr:hypothetical protein MILUP08_46293 [Micromonospora lupini str. Lupac 08]